MTRRGSRSQVQPIGSVASVEAVFAAGVACFFGRSGWDSASAG